MKPLPRHFPPVLAAVLLFGLFLTVHLRDNAFPFFYHTDEPSKVAQILTGERNGRHPTLLLNSASLILRLSGWTPTRDHAAQAGRIASAIFAAGAISLFFLWAWLQTGWTGGWLAALLVGLQPPLLTAAHFVKEDPALLLGLAATLLLALLYERKPDSLRAFGLGAAAGLAVSGKWVGIATVAIAIAQIILTSGRKPRHWLLCAAGILAIFLLTNHDLIRQWNVVQAGVSSEVTSFYSTDAGQTRGFHFQHYLRRLPEVFPWTLLILAAVGVWQIWRRPASRHLRMFSLLPVAWFLMISCIPKTENRYLLPVATFLGMLAALALVEIIRLCRARGRLPGLAALALTGALILSLIPDYREAVASFRHDHRRELAHWIATNLPAQALIAQDQRTALRASGDPRYDPGQPLLARRVLPGEKNYVSDYGTLAELRAAGVTHVALFISNYLVLLEHGGKKADTPQEIRAAQFYRELQSGAKPVFTRRKGFDRYLNVGLVLYEIAPAQAGRPEVDPAK